MERSTSSPDAVQPGQMGAWAPYYDLIMKFLTFGREKALREMQVDLAWVKSGETVLEVGCGTGTLTLAVSRRIGASGAVHGVDIAPEMIRIARRKNVHAGNPVTFQVGQIDRLPYPDAAFDAVICSFMIFHMPDDVRQRGLADIFRVLRANGRLVVIDAAKANLDALQRSMAEAGFLEIDSGRRKVAPLTPSVRYVRATARKDQRPA